MSLPSTITTFQNTVSQWLHDEITEPRLLNVSTSVVRRSGRNLQDGPVHESVYHELEINGSASFSNSYVDVDFERMFGLLFENDGDKLVSRLRKIAKDDPHQSTFYFDRIGEIKSHRGSIPDTGIIPDDGIDRGVPKGNGKAHTSIIIAACASVGAVLLFALAVFVFVNRRRIKSSGKVFDTGSTYEDDISPDEYSRSESSPWNYGKSKTIPARVADQRHMNDDNVTESGNTYSTLDRIYATDNASYQSYGYSLEDGIGSKQAGSPPPAEAEVPSPMEVDMYGLQHQARYNFAEHDDNTIEVSIGSPASTYSGLTDLGTQASFEAGGRSGRRFKSEERMNANSASADNKSPISPSSSWKTTKSYQRDCVAPPGKLGVVIDTTKHGPVVHMVKEGSPLEHVIFPGDRILSIDEVDTRGMTASGVTRVMAKKIHHERTITVSSIQKSQFL